MRTTKFKKYMVACLAGISGLMWGSVAAQNDKYPDKPIRVVAGYAPGGGTDMQARLIAQKLGEKWGQPVVVENKPGGMGLVSINSVLEAAPDGYTIYVGTQDHLVLAPSMYTGLPFDPRKDFIAVSPIATQPIIIVSHPSLPATSLKELVELARTKPGQLNFASPGNGSMAHLGAELLQSMTGTKMVHIPYKGSAPALNDLISGNGADFTFGSLASVIPYIESKKLRPIAITIDKRWPTLPDVPTSAEAGYPDLQMFTWNGVFLRAGTPDDIVAKLNSALVEILGMPDVRERLGFLGFEAKTSTPEEFTKLLDEDLKKWDGIVRDAGITKQPF